MQQELKERRPISVVEISAVVLLAATLSTTFQNVPSGQGPLVRLGFWLITLAVALGCIKLGAAQLRARAQPFDHTLVLEPAGVTLTDNLRRRTSHFAWSQVERVSITPAHFELRIRGSEAGEVYLLNRRKLSEQESAFVAKKLLEW